MIEVTKKNNNISVVTQSQHPDVTVDGVFPVALQNDTDVVVYKQESLAEVTTVLPHTVSRATVTYTGAPGSITLPMATAYTLLRVQCSAPEVRVRGYNTVVHRDDDITRAVGDYPTHYDHGLLFETYDVTDLWLTRPADGYTTDGSINVPLRIDKVGGGSVTVSLTYLATEG